MGTVGTDEKQGCKLTLPMCDKMGNRCITGGADVRCSCAGQNDVFASTNDNEDGTYALVWRSNQSGLFSVHISVEGEAIGGSPFKMQLISDVPDLTRSVALGDGLKEAQAGVPACVRLRLFDQYGNVAMGGQGLSFGMHIVRAVDKEDKNKWKRLDAPSDPFVGVWERDEYKLEYTPEIAGAFDLYLWALDKTGRHRRVSNTNNTSKRREGDGDEKGGGEGGGEGGDNHKKSSSGGGGGDSGSKMQAESSSNAIAGKSIAKEGKPIRELLGESPFRVNVLPGPADFTGSLIEGFSKGADEKGSSDGKKGAESGTKPTPDAQSGGAKPAATGAAGARSGQMAASENVLPSGSPVGAGETILFRPLIRDRFHNKVSAGDGALEVIVTLPPAGSNTASTEDDAPEGAPRETVRIPVEEHTRGDIATYASRFTPKVGGARARQRVKHSRT